MKGDVPPEPPGTMVSPPAEVAAAPDQAPPAPGFHEWLDVAIARDGRSARAISLSASTNEGLVSNLIAGRHRYPSVANMRTLIMELSNAIGPIPDIWVEGWISEATAFWYQRRRTRAAEVKVFCAECGDDFATQPSVTRIYCSLRCQGRAHFRGRLDNKLKTRFMAKVRATFPSVEQAAQELGLRSRALTAWLRRPAGRLMLPALKAVADWLDISVEEAITLQGGTAEQKRIETILAATKQWRRSQRFARRQPKITRLAAATVRAKPQTEQHKKNRGDAIRRQRREHPERWAAAAAQTKTLRGRARAVIRSLRQHHPDLTEEEIRRKAILRLSGPPYNVADKRVAVALLEPRRQKPKGGRPGINYYLIAEWRLRDPPVQWNEIGSRLDRDSDVVRAGYFQWLREFE